MAVQSITWKDPCRRVTPAMDGASDRLFASAALACDQYIGIGHRHAFDDFEQLLHRRAFSDELGKPPGCLRLVRRSAEAAAPDGLVRVERWKADRRT